MSNTLGATIHDLRTLECIDCHQYFDTTSSRNHIRCPKCSKENNRFLQGVWRNVRGKTSSKKVRTSKYVIPMMDSDQNGNEIRLWLNTKTRETWAR